MDLIERDIENIIDYRLMKKGWILDPQNVNRNVFYQQPKYDKEKYLLNGKKPDYILYLNDEPKAIIEAKRPNRNLNVALDQAIEYANKLNIEIVMATDGFNFKSMNLKNGKTLTKDGVNLDEFISEKELKSLCLNGEIESNQKSIISKKELMKTFKSANTLLRQEGLKAGDERFTEFANILFLKVLSEIESSKDTQNIDDIYLWDFWCKKPAREMLSYVKNNVIPEIKRNYKGKFLIAFK